MRESSELRWSFLPRVTNRFKGRRDHIIVFDSARARYVVTASMSHLCLWGWGRGAFRHEARNTCAMIMRGYSLHLLQCSAVHCGTYSETKAQSVVMSLAGHARKLIMVHYGGVVYCDTFPRRSILSAARSDSSAPVETRQ